MNTVMISLEPTFTCDGALVLGYKCNRAVAGQVIRDREVPVLPAHWAHVLIQGVRRQLCPACNQWWHANGRKARHVAPDAESFEKRCKAADWYYDFSDDHGVWSAGFRECNALREIARMYPELQPIINNYANQTTNS